MKYNVGQLVVRGKPVYHRGKACGVLAVRSKEVNVEVRITEIQITALIAALQELRSTVCAARKELQN